MDDEVKENTLRVNRFLDQLTGSSSPINLDTRGENAFGVAVKFLTLLDSSIEDREELRKLMSAWFKSVRDNDYKKFKRALRRYHRKDQEEEVD